MNFNPNRTACHSNIFGVPCSKEDASLILLPVPWEVTTSSRGGASLGPELILSASYQVDLYHPLFKDFYKKGIFFDSSLQEIKKLNAKNKKKAQKIISALELRGKLSESDKKLQKEVNAASKELNKIIYNRSLDLLDKNKKIGLLGGDHSVPFGLIKALSERHSFSVLHIDAHADLRKSYQGFEHSHASIMNQVMNLKNPPESLVQVGIRDFCHEEKDFIENNPNLHTFFDGPTKRKLFEGKSWALIVQDIITKLGENVYISFDIDGLDPALCPNTGTPVPGGLSFDQVVFLISELSLQKKNIIGFDLVEVASQNLEQGLWDGNVGARLLYNLCGASLT